jgi:hypothetical protein
MKLMGIVVMLILSVMTTRSCSPSSPSSPLNPVNLANNGMAGLCANQQAEADASGDNQSPVTVVSPSEATQLQTSNPGGMQALAQAMGGNVSCPTTTVYNGGS